MKAKRTSLSDIAKALNVSKATVSFVLNDKGDQFNISKEKQRLIKEKAKELLYVPNFFAKSLRHGETKTIGLVLPDISNPFYAEMSKTIQEKLHGLGYTTFIVNTNDDKDLEKVLMTELIQRSIDGMIIAPSNQIDKLVPILVATHIPVIFTDRAGDENTDFVGINNLEESAGIINLFSKTPKRVTTVVPIPSNVSTIKERIKGAKGACKKENISFNSIDLPAEQSEVDALIKKEIDNGTDSFIALNNKCTLPVLAALRNLNIDVPESVRLISFDDSESFNYMDPPVSALRLPIADIGSKSVDRLCDRLKKSKDPGAQFLLDCTFQVRGSH